MITGRQQGAHNCHIFVSLFSIPVRMFGGGSSAKFHAIPMSSIFTKLLQKLMSHLVNNVIAANLLSHCSTVLYVLMVLSIAINSSCIMRRSSCLQRIAVLRLNSGARASKVFEILRTWQAASVHAEISIDSHAFIVQH